MDIGTGTGLLSMMAVTAGADFCYAIEVEKLFLYVLTEDHFPPYIHCVFWTLMSLSLQDFGSRSGLNPRDDAASGDVSVSFLSAGF